MRIQLNSFGESQSHIAGHLTYLVLLGPAGKHVALQDEQGKSAENDPILQEIVTMLSFDGSEHCWAVFCLGAETEMVKAKGDTIMKCLTDFEAWKKNAEDAGFLPALIHRLKEIQPPDHCNRLILPGITGTIPERVVCSECKKPMEKFIMYRCCDE